MPRLRPAPDLGDIAAANHAAALALAQAGLPVFPATVAWNTHKAKYDKQPIVAGWQQLATANTAQVTDWFTSGTHVVPGIELRRAGLIVIDADRHRGGADGVTALQALLQDQIDWPPHPTITTAGGGEHHYFRQPAGIELNNSAGDLPKGIDIRACGGWAVAPGAIRSDGKAWKPAPGAPSLIDAYLLDQVPELPSWLVELIRPPRPEKERARSEPEATPWSAAEESRVRSALTKIAADDRDTWRNVGMALCDTLWPCARAMWDGWSTTSSKYFADDQTRAWQSFARTTYSGPRVTLASVFALAIDNGWREVSDAKPDTPPPASPLPIHWYKDGDPYADVDELVEGLLPEVGSGLLSGPWGSYKGFVATDLAGAIMTGGTYAGRAVRRRGGVLYIAAEGASEVMKRMRARHLACDGLADDVLPFAWLDACPLLLDKAALPQLTATAKHAAAQIQRDYDLPLALILIDTLASAAGYEGEMENWTGPTQKVMNVLRDLSAATGALALGIDHTGKDPEAGTRGASGKEGAADVIHMILGTREDTGRMVNTRLVVRKLRRGVSGIEIPFSMRPTEPEPGKATGTLTVDWHDASTTRPRSSRWPKKLRTLKRALDIALDEHGEELRPFGAEGPLVRAVDNKQVREEFYATYPADGDTKEKQAEAKRQAFYRYIRDAQNDGLVATRDIAGTTYIWLVSDKSEDA